MIPGLTTKKKLEHADKLLRRPLAPKVLPPLVTEENNKLPSLQYNKNDSIINMFQASFLEVVKSLDTESEHPTDEATTSVTLACPPPTTGSNTQNNFNVDSKSLDPCPAFSRNFLFNKDDMKYFLDPAYREGIRQGSHVQGKHFMKPYKLRGPDPLPARAPRKNPGVLMFYDSQDRYSEPPAFVLDHFVHKFAEKNNLSLPQVRKAVYSKHNFKRLTDLLSQELNHSGQDVVHTVKFDPSDIPPKENRVPWRQLLCEMEALMRTHLDNMDAGDLKPSNNLSRKHGLEYLNGSHDTGVVLFHENGSEITNQSTIRKIKIDQPELTAVYSNLYSHYLQRTKSKGLPQDLQEQEEISVSNLAVLDSMAAGGTSLSFEGHFIEILPDIYPLTTRLVSLNICFNNFQTCPSEILELKNLEILKMRNNPLVELPKDINKLRHLRVLVASFCLISDLPVSLFGLPFLEELDLAYNRLTVMPSWLGQLQCLQYLDLEGNQIPALPVSCLNLKRLTNLNVRNNFMHPVFWQENSRNKVQSLKDLTSVQLCTVKNQRNIQHLPEEISNILKREEKCNICKGPLFGPGLRTIRPLTKFLFVKHLPVLFRACTPGCLNHFKNMNSEELQIFLYGE